MCKRDEFLFYLNNQLGRHWTNFYKRTFNKYHLPIHLLNSCNLFWADSYWWRTDIWLPVQAIAWRRMPVPLWSSQLQRSTLLTLCSYHSCESCSKGNNFLYKGNRGSSYSLLGVYGRIKSMLCLYRGKYLGSKVAWSVF